MTVAIYDYESLPAWVDRDDLSNHGAGKKWASYLVIEDGNYRACYSDAMEPEDIRFHRDLKWIKHEIERARADLVERIMAAVEAEQKEGSPDYTDPNVYIYNSGILDALAAIRRVATEPDTPKITVTPLAPMTPDVAFSGLSLEETIEVVREIENSAKEC